MNKKVNKLVQYLLAGTMSLALLAGCANTAPSNTAPDNDKPSDTTGTSEVISTENGSSQATYGVIKETKNGKLLGRNEDGINIFLGIPYATAERWQMPVAAQPWEGLRNANYVGPVAPQSGGSGEYLSNPAYYRVDASEKDFLNLNVWTPDMESDEAKPVIVWIHGGGYASGSSMELLEYDGKNLSEYGDIVFVSVNHRLNYLGYMDFSQYGEKYARSANVGHADLIMALEWVRDNIADFGGDPSNVTIVGQSGGSQKVCQLMAMPAAKGLFQKVVAQSPGAYSFDKTPEQAQAETAALVEQLGLTGHSNEEIMDVLANMDYDDLVAACQAAGVNPGAVADGEYVLQDISGSTDVPLMIGTVFSEFNANLSSSGITGSYRNGTILRDEQAYYDNVRTYLTEEDVVARYEERYGDSAQAIMDAFKKAYPNHDLFDGLYINTGFRSDDTVRNFTEKGGTAYYYIAAYTLPLFGGGTSWHTGGDIAFFFRNLDCIHSWIAGDEENAWRYADAASNALINFVRTGTPSSSDLEWPAFTVENGETMLFDSESKVANYPERELLELIKQAQQ